MRDTGEAFIGVWSFLHILKSYDLLQMDWTDRLSTEPQGALRPAELDAQKSKAARAVPFKPRHYSYSCCQWIQGKRWSWDGDASLKTITFLQICQMWCFYFSLNSRFCKGNTDKIINSEDFWQVSEAGRVLRDRLVTSEVTLFPATFFVLLAANSFKSFQCLVGSYLAPQSSNKSTWAL